MHSIKKETPIHQETVEQKMPTPFWLLPQIPDYEPHYEQDPFWDDDLYSQDKLEYKQNFNKPPEQNEDDDIITD